MKHFAIACTLLLTLSANKCSDTPESMAGLMDTKWNIESLAGIPLQMPADAVNPWLKLSGDQLQGFGGCNQLMGQYQLDGTALSFLGVGSTKKFCEGIQPTETAIMEMLTKVDAFKMDKGMARLFGAGKELASLKASGE